MEIGNHELKSTSPVVKHVEQSIWKKLGRALIHIPIAENNAKNIEIFSKQLDAPSLTKMRALLERHGETIAKVSGIAATTLDVALATACGALSVTRFRAMGSEGDRKKIVAHLEKNPLQNRLLGDRQEMLAKNKKTVVPLGVLGGSILVIRPVSRLMHLGSIVGKSMSERVGQIVNHIAGGGRSV